MPSADRHPPFIGHKADEAARNLAAIRRYYATHLGCTARQCAAALGLNERTVGIHLKTLRKEWPDDGR